MNNSSNSALLALLLTASLAISLLVACTDDDGGEDGISLTQSELTATATGTVPLDRIGTVPQEPDFARAFAEIRAQIEAGLGTSPLSDDPEVDELVGGCDGVSSEGEAQFQACIDLLELLVAQGVPELQDLIDLTAEHAASEFPERQDEIDAATEPTTAPDNQVDPTETIPAGTIPIG